MEVVQTVGVLIVDNGKVLLVKHWEKAVHVNDVYWLPAGRLKDWESFIQAAMRELNEETWLIVEFEQLKPLEKVYSADITRKDGTKRMTINVFRAVDYSWELKSSEETQPVWIELDRVGELNLLPNIEEIIKDGLEKFK